MRIVAPLVSVKLILALAAAAALSACENSSLPGQPLDEALNVKNVEQEHGHQGVVLGTRVHILPKRDGIQGSSAPANAHLTYYGGRVVSNLQVVQVLWGTGGAGGGTGQFLANVKNTSSPSIATFYEGVLNSPYVDWLTEYNTTVSGGTNQTIGRGSFVGQYVITPSTQANPVDDTAIQTELANQIAANNLPAPTTDAAGNNNTYYAIFFPHGQRITSGGSGSCVAGGFCAYHGTVASAGGYEIYYGVHPDMQAGSGCDLGCGTGTVFGNYTSVASHEMTETITDCEVGLATVYAPPLAWYDHVNGEIGDICNAQQGSMVGSDGVTYTVQKEFSNAANNCIVSRTTSDFTIKASPGTVSVAAGASAQVTIATTTVGTAETVNLAASGAPSGVTLSLSPSSVTSGGSATLTITAAAGAAAGTATLTVTGTGSSGSHSTTVALTVLPPVTPSDFSVSAAPTALSVQAGSGGTVSVSTSTVAGAAETVALSVSGLPAGVSGSLSPASVTSGGGSTLTLSASAGAAVGTFTVTVTGTAASGGPHSAAIALTVTAPPPSDFTVATSPGTLSLTQGTSGAVTVSTTAISVPEVVSLSVSGLPAGVTASFNPSSVNAGANSSLTFSASSSAALGSAIVTITGTAASGGPHSATVTLTITAPPPSDFTVTASPGTLSIKQGASGAVTVSTSAISAPEVVSLSVSGLPAGVTASFNPSSVNAGARSSLTFTAASSAALGSATVTITGTAASGGPHSATVTLTVTRRRH
jgi:hypothetical protein